MSTADLEIIKEDGRSDIEQRITRNTTAEVFVENTIALSSNLIRDFKCI